MPLNFPSSPTLNQTHSVGDRTWKYNGVGWQLLSPELADSGVAAGTYTKLTVDAKGRVTSGTTLAATDIPLLTAANISDFDTQVRTSRLDQMAAPTASVSLNSQKITSLGTPTADGDAATKAYVDAIKQGLDIKDSVRVATTANITLSAPQTIDGVSVVAGDRVLVKDQSTGSENGIYVVATEAWTRAVDADASADVTAGLFVFVAEGSTYADSGWVLTTNDPITLGTTALTFTQFSGAGQITAGTGLSKSGNTLSVSFGSTGTTACVGNDARLSDTRNTTNSVTFNNGGAGAASGTTFNGDSAVTVSYNTVGAPSTTGTNASGSWGISITGTATTATTANGLNTSNNYQVNSLGVGTAGSGTAGEIRATNNITAYYSDDRLKTKLGPLANALAAVERLSGFYYKANETAQALGYKPVREVGVSAQEVQAVLPEAVAPAPIDEQYLTVRYERLVPLLIEAVKELSARVSELESR